MSPPNPDRANRAFTLLELLVAVAIVAALSALLFPSFASARRAAAVARTKAQFAQWTIAIEGFRSEYGHYPVVDDSGLVNGGVIGPVHPFHDVLAGRHRDGTPLTSGSIAVQQNPKGITFAAFTASDFNDADLLRDGFGTTEIAVLVDRDLDGRIRAGADFPALPALGGAAPSAADFPAAGIRASVVFYARIPGTNAGDGAFVWSWK